MRITRPRVASLVLALTVSGCGKPEDPARLALRARLKQGARLSTEELSGLLDEARRSLVGKTVRYRQNDVTAELDPDQRKVVLGMLDDRNGVYDEGLQTSDNARTRVINAPGDSIDAEYVTIRRLWIDVDTFLPRHFELTNDVARTGGYSLDLLVDR